jgi:hypothetical protein
MKFFFNLVENILIKDTGIFFKQLLFKLFSNIYFYIYFIFQYILKKIIKITILLFMFLYYFNNIFLNILLYFLMKILLIFKNLLLKLYFIFYYFFLKKFLLLCLSFIIINLIFYSKYLIYNIEIINKHSFYFITQEIINDFLNLEKKNIYSQTSSLITSFSDLPFFIERLKYSFSSLTNYQPSSMIPRHYGFNFVNIDSLDYWNFRKEFGKGWIFFDLIVEKIYNDNFISYYLRIIQFYLNFLILNLLFILFYFIIFLKYFFIFSLYFYQSIFLIKIFSFELIIIDLNYFLIDYLLEITDLSIFKLISFFTSFILSFINLFIDEILGLFLRYITYFSWQEETIHSIYPTLNRRFIVETNLKPMFTNKEGNRLILANLNNEKYKILLSSDFLSFGQKYPFIRLPMQKFHTSLIFPYSTDQDSFLNYSFLVKIAHLSFSVNFFSFLTNDYVFHYHKIFLYPYGNFLNGTAYHDPYLTAANGIMQFDFRHHLSSHFITQLDLDFWPNKFNNDFLVSNKKDNRKDNLNLRDSLSIIYDNFESKGILYNKKLSYFKRLYKTLNYYGGLNEVISPVNINLGIKENSKDFIRKSAFRNIRGLALNNNLYKNDLLPFFDFYDKQANFSINSTNNINSFRKGVKNIPFALSNSIPSLKEDVFLKSIGKFYLFNSIFVRFFFKLIFLDPYYAIKYILYQFKFITQILFYYFIIFFFVYIFFLIINYLKYNFISIFKEISAIILKNKSLFFKFEDNYFQGNIFFNINSYIFKYIILLFFLFFYNIFIIIYMYIYYFYLFVCFCFYKMLNYIFVFQKLFFVKLRYLFNYVKNLKKNYLLKFLNMIFNYTILEIYFDFFLKKFFYFFRNIFYYFFKVIFLFIVLNIYIYIYNYSFILLKNKFFLDSFKNNNNNLIESYSYFYTTQDDFSFLLFYLFIMFLFIILGLYYKKFRYEILLVNLTEISLFFNKNNSLSNNFPVNEQYLYEMKVDLNNNNNFSFFKSLYWDFLPDKEKNRLIFLSNHDLSSLYDQFDIKLIFPFKTDDSSYFFKNWDFYYFGPTVLSFYESNTNNTFDKDISLIEFLKFEYLYIIVKRTKLIFYFFYFNCFFIDYVIFLNRKFIFQMSLNKFLNNYLVFFKLRLYKKFLLIFKFIKLEWSLKTLLFINSKINFIKIYFLFSEKIVNLFNLYKLNNLEKNITILDLKKKTQLFDVHLEEVKRSLKEENEGDDSLKIKLEKEGFTSKEALELINSSLNIVTEKYIQDSFSNLLYSDLMFLFNYSNIKKKMVYDSSFLFLFKINQNITNIYKLDELSLILKMKDFIFQKQDNVTFFNRIKKNIINFFYNLGFLDLITSEEYNFVLQNYVVLENENNKLLDQNKNLINFYYIDFSFIFGLNFLDNFRYLKKINEIDFLKKNYLESTNNLFNGLYLNEKNTLSFLYKINQWKYYNSFYNFRFEFKNNRNDLLFTYKLYKRILINLNLFSKLTNNFEIMLKNKWIFYEKILKHSFTINEELNYNSNLNLSLNRLKLFSNLENNLRFKDFDIENNDLIILMKKELGSINYINLENQSLDFIKLFYEQLIIKNFLFRKLFIINSKLFSEIILSLIAQQKNCSQLFFDQSSTKLLFRTPNISKRNFYFGNFFMRSLNYINLNYKEDIDDYVFGEFFYDNFLLGRINFYENDKIDYYITNTIDFDRSGIALDEYSFFDDLFDEFDIEEFFYDPLNDSHPYSHKFILDKPSLSDLFFHSMPSNYKNPYHIYLFEESLKYSDNFFVSKNNWVIESLCDKFVFYDIKSENIILPLDYFILSNVSNIIKQYKGNTIFENINNNILEYNNIIFNDLSFFFFNNLPFFIFTNKKFFYLKVLYPYLNSIEDVFKLKDNKFVNINELNNYIIFYNPYNNSFLEKINNILKIITYPITYMDQYRNKFTYKFFLSIENYFNILKLENYPQLSKSEIERICSFLGCSLNEWNNVDQHGKRRLFPYDPWGISLGFFFIIFTSMIRKESNVLDNFYEYFLLDEEGSGADFFFFLLDPGAEYVSSLLGKNIPVMNSNSFFFLENILNLESIIFYFCLKIIYFFFEFFNLIYNFFIFCNYIFKINPTLYDCFDFNTLFQVFLLQANISNDFTYYIFSIISIIMGLYLEISLYIINVFDIFLIICSKIFFINNIIGFIIYTIYIYILTFKFIFFISLKKIIAYLISIFL